MLYFSKSVRPLYRQVIIVPVNSCTISHLPQTVLHQIQLISVILIEDSEINRIPFIHEVRICPGFIDAQTKALDIVDFNMRCCPAADNICYSCIGMLYIPFHHRHTL